LEEKEVEEKELKEKKKNLKEVEGKDWKRRYRGRI
jgi:hypothetical protein